jgi:hypothetical protein
VAPDSFTETFAAVKFYLDNWRWHGVPFSAYGKAPGRPGPAQLIHPQDRELVWLVDREAAALLPGGLPGLEKSSGAAAGPRKR